MRLKQVMVLDTKAIEIYTENTDDWDGIAIFISSEDATQDSIELNIRDKEVRAFNHELSNHVARLDNSVELIRDNEYMLTKETLLHFTDGTKLGISFLNYGTNETQLRFNHSSDTIYVTLSNEEFIEFHNLVDATISRMESTSLMSPTKDFA